VSGDPEAATRTAQYELAYRMQAAVPELMSIQGETQSTLKMYGAVPGKASFANNCLLAQAAGGTWRANGGTVRR
jgi:hypothetical protein